MSVYENAMKVMKDLFGKDALFALATARENVPSVRFIDTYYEEGSFYIVTYAKSQKVDEIEVNKEVALCNKQYRFTGKAYNIGHPMKPENKEIRETLIKVFEPWYFAHNNEEDENMCFVKVELETGFFYQNRIGYQVDFREKTAEEFPFEFEIVLSE